MKQLSKSNSTLFFILLTGILIVVAFISYNKILQYNESVEGLMRISRVKTTIEKILSNLKDAEIEQRGYLLTGDSAYLKSFSREGKDSTCVLDTLASLISNNPQQQKNLERLKTMVFERYAILDFNATLLENIYHSALAIEALKIGKNKMDEVRSQILLMLETEDKLITERTHYKDRTASITPIFLLALSLLSIIVISFFFFRLQKETHERITVTESHKLLQEANQKIEASEKRFRTLSENIPHMMWTATADGRKNFFNQFFLDYTGSTFEELEGEGWHKVIYPDDLERENVLWKEILKTGKDFTFEKRVRHHSGEYRWHISQGIAQKNNEGFITGWIGTNTDITEQRSFTEELEKKVKERTAELQERKNFVETILETSKEYIAVFATDFTLLSLNKSAEILIGKKREDVLGEKFLELFPQAQGTKAEIDLQYVFNGETIRNPAHPSSVTRRYIENYLTPLRDNNGNIYAALAIANDVTNMILKQKEIEASNYQLQLQNRTFEIAEKIATLGSYKWNITTNELAYSNNLFRLLDCEPQEFTPSIEKFLSFIHPDDLQEVIKKQEQTIEKETLVESPYRIISKTGTIKYFHSSGNFFIEGGNRFFIGTVQDITNDIVASKELKAKNIELENANAELASFNYVASHDLQEPLRKIQGFSKRIINEEGEYLSDTAKDYFKRINGAASRMQILITSILSYSRTNSADLVFEETDLNQILNEVKITLNESILMKNVVIESQKLPTVNAIPIQMHQLFLNLIGNSIKYAKQDMDSLIKITAEKITIHETDGQEIANGFYWKLTISDNGIGFEQQYEDKIFEVFQRLHGKTDFEGTGIGLSICKKIIQVHRGIISAKGEPRVGATFTFLLPAN